MDGKQFFLEIIKEGRAYLDLALSKGLPVIMAWLVPSPLRKKEKESQDDGQKPPAA